MFHYDFEYTCDLKRKDTQFEAVILYFHNKFRTNP